MGISKYSISNIEIVSNNIKIFKLISLEKKPDGEKFKPGQFVFIHILDQSGKSIDKRPYSIASAPGEQYLEFCIDMINGRFTSKLDQIKIGEVVGVEGSLGHLAYEGQERIGTISGGTGIAPMMSMMRDIAKRKNATAISFYSVKIKDRIIFRDEIERMNKTGRAKTVITITKDEENKKWKGERGRITKEMITKHAADAASRDWYICGPMEMIKTMKETLLQLGVDPKKIKMEGWG